MRQLCTALLVIAQHARAEADTPNAFSSLASFFGVRIRLAVISLLLMSCVRIVQQGRLSVDREIMKMEKLLVWVSISIMMEIYLLGNTKILIMYLKEMESELFIIAMVNNLPLLGPMEKY